MKHLPEPRWGRDLPAGPLNVLIRKHRFIRTYAHEYMCTNIRLALEQLCCREVTASFAGRLRKHGRSWHRQGQERQAQRASSTPNGGPHLELRRKRLKTGFEPTSRLLRGHVYIFVHVFMSFSRAHPPTRYTQRTKMYICASNNRTHICCVCSK